MRAFEIGFVPAGWTKGERLSIYNPRWPDKYGSIWQRDINFDLEKKISGDDIACLTFDVGGVVDVNKWLEWWYGGTNNLTIEVER